MGLFNFRANRSIGIDLGTANTLVYSKKHKKIVLNEPSVVAVERETKRVLAVGNEAKEMLGKTPDTIVAVRPLSEGVIADYDITEAMIKYFIKKIFGTYSFFMPEIMICVPIDVTGVEKRAVLEAAISAGAKKAYLIEEARAAAIGSGMDISVPEGNMIIDIGGGSTDVAIISLGGTVVSKTIRVAGNNFDSDIIKYVKKTYNLLIGDRTAEEIKMKIGTALPLEEEETMEVKGRNLVTGLPKTIEVNSDETLEALREPAMQIVDSVHNVLERTPPELAADVYDRGIVLTGGGALLSGLDALIEEKTGINTVIADNPLTAVAIGTGKFIEFRTGNKGDSKK